MDLRGLQTSVQEAPGRGAGCGEDGAWLSVTGQASRLPRLGCGGAPCSPMPHSPEECRRLRTCSECLARHPRTLQPGDGEVSDGVGGGGECVSGTTGLFTWDQVAGTETGGVLGALTTPLSQYLSPRPLPHAVSGVPTAPRVPALGATGPAPQRMTVASTSARSSGLGTARRLCAGRPTASSAPGRASACGRGSSRGRVSARPAPREDSPGRLDSCSRDARGSAAWCEVGRWGAGKGPGPTS